MFTDREFEVLQDALVTLEVARHKEARLVSNSAERRRAADMEMEEAMILFSKITQQRMATKIAEPAA